jgi:hypothetical protein
MVTLLAALAPAAAAHAQAPLPPSLTLDTFFASPFGLANDEVSTNIVADTPAGVAVHGDRIYTVGTTGSTGQDVGITARGMDATLDPTFDGDGKRTLSVASGSKADFGMDIAVLPDGHLRVLARSDVSPSTTTVQNFDVAIVGLKPDGTLDTEFGTGGKVTFQVAAGTAADTPRRMAIGPGGRIAVTGAANGDLFVALRDDKGAPVNSFDDDGVKLVNQGGGSVSDSGVDVVFRPDGGVMTLVAVDSPVSAFLLAFEDGGDPDLSFAGGTLRLEVGGSETGAGGLVEHGGRYYVSGATRIGSDIDAFIARVGADGGGLQSRRFDMRGRVVLPGVAAASRAADLVAVPGVPETLVVVGSVTYTPEQSSTATDWAAAAFNGFEGDLAQAGYGDLVLSIPGDSGLLAGAAGPDRSVAVAGVHRQSDDDFGNARLLIDADKSCDLAVAVAEPAEIVFRGLAPAALTARVTNVGTRPCGGTLSLPAPYRMTPVNTGSITPGVSVTTGSMPVAYTGARRAEDILSVKLAAAGDANSANNEAVAHVVFSFCDLTLEPVGRAGAIPTEGVRRFPVTLRNRGTIGCSVRIGSKPPYTLAPARSVADRVAARAPRGARPRTRVRVLLQAGAAGDVEPGNNAAAVSPVVVGVGDSDIRQYGARGFSGTARKGAGTLAADRLRVEHVDVALLRKGAKKCAWLRSPRGSFKAGEARAGGGCKGRRWVRAKGTKSWRLRLGERLPPGRYVLLSRATIGAGFGEARSSAADRNRVEFRIR